MSIFIAIEGPDCSGTSTQTALLAKRFARENLTFTQTYEPADNKIGRFIRECLFERPLPNATAFQMLYCCDRSEHQTAVVEPSLAAGKHVLCERSHLSTMVYGQATGADIKLLESIGEHFIKPDLTIITLPPFEVCKQRLLEREEVDEFEKIDFQQKVYDLYAAQAGENVVFVDTSGEVEESAEEIWNHVYPLLSE